MEKKVTRTRSKIASRAGRDKKQEARSKMPEGGKLAILRIGGSQHLVREGSQLDVNQLSLKEGVGQKVEVTLLEPLLGKGIATIKLVEQKKGPKVVVMKYKAKSRYRRKRGFRARLSRIIVEKINGA